LYFQVPTFIELHAAPVVANIFFISEAAFGHLVSTHFFPTRLQAFVQDSPLFPRIHQVAIWQGQKRRSVPYFPRHRLLPWPRQ
jgi:hypothetical protein